MATWRSNSGAAGEGAVALTVGEAGSTAGVIRATADGVGEVRAGGADGGVALAIEGLTGVGSAGLTDEIRCQIPTPASKTTIPAIAAT